MITPFQSSDHIHLEIFPEEISGIQSVTYDLDKY